MREQLVAWAGDCRVQGDVELGDGRLSDRVNEMDLVTFFDATLTALDDGREVQVGEMEVERRELHVIEVHGRQGDPDRRLRTVRDRVMLQIGPFTVTGSIHRSPSTRPLAALAGWTRFLPVTDAEVGLPGHRRTPVHQEVVLVNRERITKHERLPEIGVYASEPWPPLPTEDPPSQDQAGQGEPVQDPPSQDPPSQDPPEA
jgi:hypothetical protein